MNEPRRDDGLDAEALRERLAATMLPALGLAERAIHVEAPPERGTRSSLHKVIVEGMPPLLARAYRHFGQAGRNVRALRHMEAIGLDAPRLVWSDASWRTALRPSAAGWYLTVETWIEGTAISRLATREQYRAASLKAAALLAGYRRFTQEGWGRPGYGRSRSWADHTLRQARMMVRSVRARGWIDAAEARQLRDLISRWRAPIAALTTYTLVHKDINPANVILTGAGKVVPVDLHRLAYEPFPEEVVNALHHFCPLDPVLERDFLSACLDTGDGATRRHFDSVRPFFSPVYYLKKLHRRAGSRRVMEPDRLARWRAAVLAIVPPGEVAG